MMPKYMDPPKSRPFDILHGVSPVLCPICGKPTKVELQFRAEGVAYQPNLNHYSLGASLIGSTRITGEFPGCWTCKHCFPLNGVKVFTGKVYIKAGRIEGYHLDNVNMTYRFNGGNILVERGGGRDA